MAVIIAGCPAVCGVGQASAAPPGEAHPATPAAHRKQPTPPTEEPTMSPPDTSPATQPAGNAALTWQAAGVAELQGLRVQRWRASNGLTLWLVPDEDRRAVAYQTWFATGSADDPPGAGGAAHLLEHMMFKGTAAYPPGALDRALERVGASANAATWLDWTSYDAVVPTDALAELVAMEADRALHLRVDPASFAAERDVVLQERREAVDDDPDGALDELLAGYVWGKGHPYARPTLGVERSVRALTADALEGQRRARYRPDCAHIVVAGRFDAAAVRSLVGRGYAGWAAPSPASPSAPRASVPAARPKPGLHRASVPVAAPRVLVAWPAVGADHEDHPTLALAAALLAGGPGSRLHRKLVDEAGLAAEVAASIDYLRGPSMWQLQIVGRHGVAATRVVEAVQRAIAELATQAVGSDQLDAARNRLRMRWLADLEHASGRAEVIGETAAMFGELSVRERWWTGLKAVTPAQLRAAVGRWLPRDGAVIVVAEPS